MKPWELETTVWNVWRVGREIRADWLVIQRWRTESKVFANTIRYLKLTKRLSNSKYGVTCPVPESYLEDGSIFLGQLCSYSRMVVSKLQEVAKEGNSRNLWEILDLWGVCAVRISEDDVENRYEDKANDLIRHDR